MGIVRNVYATDVHNRRTTANTNLNIVIENTDYLSMYVVSCPTAAFSNPAPYLTHAQKIFSSTLR